MNKRIDLALSGMHCASCALIIKKSLEKEQGVEKVNVNFATEKASVIFAGDKSTENKLIQAVENAGYKAEIITEKTSHSQDERKLQELKNIKTKLISSLILSLPLLVFMFVDFPSKAIVSMLLATPVQFVIGWSFYQGAWSALKNKTFNMDSLIAIGTTVAYIYSLINLILGRPDLYFETSVLLITFVFLGKYLETKAKMKTNEAVKKLVGLQAKTAHIVKKGKVVDVKIENLKLNNIVLVRPGEKIPVDGIIIKGSSYIDQSMITGESIPVSRKIDDEVIGGTINKLGSFEFKVTKIGNNTLLSQIIVLVEQAQGSRAPLQNLADKISAYFVPAVLITAILTFGIWFFFLHATLTYSLMSMISVIVIACPCVLGLATPTAIMVGTGKAAENGILIKGGEPLEKASKINYLVFDKTGTLTVGKPMVTDLISLNNKNTKEILQIAASLEKHSEHPLAETVYKYAQTKESVLTEITDFKAQPGLGVIGMINQEKYFFGNTRLITKLKIDFDQKIAEQIRKLEEEGKTVLILSDSKQVLGLIAVADTLKPLALAAITGIRQKKVEVVMLTGDNQRVAQAIAKQLGIQKVFAEVLPGDKAALIKKLQQQGNRVAMAGDGINDAPALAQADLGIVMGSGSDIALEAGDVIILKNDLQDLIKLINLSRSTVAKIKQNLFFALIYNILGIPVAARVFAGVGLILKPELAGLAMALSSVSVVTNSLILRLRNN